MFIAHYMNVATNVTGYSYAGPFNTARECQDWCDKANAELQANMREPIQFRYYEQAICPPNL